MGLGGVDFVDVLAMVEGFQSRPTAPSKAATDLYDCTPDGLIDFRDIQSCVDGFQGRSFAASVDCPNPCP